MSGWAWLILFAACCAVAWELLHAPLIPDDTDTGARLIVISDNDVELEPNDDWDVDTLLQTVREIEAL